MVRSKEGYAKILKTCQIALSDGIHYVWVDTCCINKASSAELAQGINSMFKWYQDAKVCYAYLADWDSVTPLDECWWFMRGWTLQELIAPKIMKFFGKNWDFRGTKSDLCDELSRITSIDESILKHEKPLSSLSVAKRLSWASKRVTRRVEDMAYCLLGIFDIAMPMLYGEGQKAFYRPQEEILRSTCDLSLLCWTPSTEMHLDYCGFFAQSVADFEFCQNMDLITDKRLDDGELHLTSKGLKIGVPEYLLEVDKTKTTKTGQYALKLDCIDSNLKEEGDFLTIPMRKIGPNIFVRARALPSEDNNKQYNFSPVPVAYGQCEVRNQFFLTTLPRSTLPLQRGLDICALSRSTLVKIEFKSNISADSIRRAPNEVWDEEDYAFFGSPGSLDNWAAIGFNEFNMLFVCFWKKRDGEWEFHGTLIRTDDEDRDPLWRDLLIFGDNFGYAAPSVEDILASYPHEETKIIRRDVGGKRREMAFTYELKKGSRLCSGPEWTVKFKTL